MIRSVTVKDNGIGIPKEELGRKFSPFYESEKVEENLPEKHNSLLHGRRGIGRLTFFVFANSAKWETTFSKNQKKYKYEIKINGSSLEKYDADEKETQETTEETGTMVSFSGIKSELREIKLLDEIMEYLRYEFGWYLELNKPFGKKLIINGEGLNYHLIIADKEEKTILCGTPETKFLVHYIQWKGKINDEYSKFYYIDEKNNEKYKENTTLNNKGDQFYHSVYIQSDYFNRFNFIPAYDAFQQSLSNDNTPDRSDETFKCIQKELTDFLRKKRKPFLRKHSQQIVAELQEQKIIQYNDKSPVEKIQGEELKSVIRGVYEIEPKLFSGVNREQKKAVVEMIQTLLQSDDRDKIVEIMEHVVTLETGERKELADLLKVTKLSSIIKTINLIKHRYQVIEALKKINFDSNFGANEVDHLQKVVEANTWLFGEQYHLLAAADDSFEKALRAFLEKIYGESEPVTIDHPDKRKEVDIFICKQKQESNFVNNIIIELKHPDVRIGEKEVSQIKQYQRVIQQEPRFNADKFTWEYILIGARFNSSNYIEGEIENQKRYGEPGLIYNVPQHKIYVRKWSDVIIECELKHQYLNQKLEIQREKLASEITSPEVAVDIATKKNG